MNYSFYGGRRGASFVITGRFSSIKEMVKNFSQGSNYSVINYDEYIIIDTVNKNNPDNGKIFRRGYNYQDELGGAQYVGQIVGPSGLAPKIEMTTLEEVQNIQKEEDFEYHFSEGEYGSSINLVPGKDGESFNDSIKWACCSVRDKNNKDTTAYLGFTFPYPIIEYTAKSVDSYYNRDKDSADFVNKNLVDRVDDKQHPFYSKWNISVPKGIHGDSLKNFRIISASETDNINVYPGQSKDWRGKQNPTFEGEDISRKIIVYDYYNYDRDSTGEPVSLFLGDYNMISDIAFDEDGTVRIAYTHNDDSIFSNKIKWINNVTLSQNGEFIVDFNYGGEATKYKTSLKWIDKVNFKDDGSIIFKYNDNISSDIHFDQKIKWITGVSLDLDGTLTFQYNDRTEHKQIFNKTLKWIDTINLSDNGTLTVNYNNGSLPTTWNKKFCWITDCIFTDTGDFTLKFNNGKNEVSQHIVWIKDFKINTGAEEGTGNQKMHITYNDGREIDIGNPINYIMKIAVTPDTYHLLILYSDPVKRKTIIDSGLNATYENRNDWHDCGCIKDYDGILIGANYAIDYFRDKTIVGIINQLNQELPNGFANDDAKRYGRVVTVGHAQSNKMFFGFDYSKKSNGNFMGWYYLGAFEEHPGIIAGREDDPVIQQLAQTLPVNSVWMIIE